MLANKKFAYAVLGGMIGFGIWAYPQLPDLVPTHWNVYGEVDGYSSPLSAVVLLPALTAVLLFMMRRIEQTSAPTAWYQQSPETYQTFTNGILLFMGFVYVLSLSSALGWSFEMPRLITAGLGLLFAVLGNVMGRLEPNPYFGIRMPWTLDSREVWRKTHRMFGRVWVVSGLVVFALAWIVPTQTQFAIFVPLFLFSSLGAIGYSWWLARNVAV